MKSRVLIPAILIAVNLRKCNSWPEGTYGLPMPELGCPLASGFEWEKGHRTQKTEDGSHAIQNGHLSGAESSYSNRITSNFCMKTSHTTDDESEWQKGRYCIYKKDGCPRGFRDGWIYWDDSVPLIGSTDGQEYGGDLPDGTYDRNTQIHFCCRTDGYQHEPIRLPNQSPFYLLRYGDQCQEVEGTKVYNEWVYWAGVANVNWDSKGGVHPAIDRATYPHVYTQLFYCYYEPKPPSTRLQTILTIAYVIVGIAVAVMIVLLIICIVQRCPLRKQSERDHNAEASIQESMLPIETSVIYRPGAQHKIRTAGAGVKRGAGNGPTVVNGGGMEVEPLNRASVPPPDIDSRPMSLPPSYDEVMARVNSVEG